MGVVTQYLQECHHLQLHPGWVSSVSILLHVVYSSVQSADGCYIPSLVNMSVYTAVSPNSSQEVAVLHGRPAITISIHYASLQALPDLTWMLCLSLLPSIAVPQYLHPFIHLTMPLVSTTGPNVASPTISHPGRPACLPATWLIHFAHRRLISHSARLGRLPEIHGNKENALRRAVQVSLHAATHNIITPR